MFLLFVPMSPIYEAWRKTTSTTKMELYSGIAIIAPKKSIVKSLDVAFLQSMNELQSKEHLLELQRCEGGLPWVSPGCASKCEQLPVNLPGSKAIFAIKAERTTTTTDTLPFMQRVH